MSDDNEIEANVGEEVEIDVEEAMEAAAEDAGYGVIGEAVGIRLAIQIQTWLHISPTIRRERDTSFRMSTRLNTKKLKMVITHAYKIVFVPFDPSSEEGIIFISLQSNWLRLPTKRSRTRVSN